MTWEVSFDIIAVKGIVVDSQRGGLVSIGYYLSKLILLIPLIEDSTSFWSVIKPLLPLL